MNESEAQSVVESMVDSPSHPHVNWGNVLKLLKGVGEQLPVILKIIEGLSGPKPTP